MRKGSGILVGMIIGIALAVGIQYLKVVHHANLFVPSAQECNVEWRKKVKWDVEQRSFEFYGWYCSEAIL